MDFNTWSHHTQAAHYYGVQFQTTELPPFTRVSDAFWFFRTAFSASQDPIALCSEFGLDQSHYRSFFRTLSGGEKRRVLIALAFLGDPMVVLLDEPTAGMDPSARSQFWSAVRRRRDSGRSIVCSSHDLEDMEVNCDRVAFLVDGRVRASGKVGDIVGQFGAFKTYVITSGNPGLLLSELATRLVQMKDVVWFGQVQGRVLVIVSESLIEADLTDMLDRREVHSTLCRRSNLEDIYHVCMASSEAYEDRR